MQYRDAAKKLLDPNSIDSIKLYRKARNRLGTVKRDEKRKYLKTIKGLNTKEAWKRLRTFGIGKPDAPSDLQDLTPDQLNNYFCTLPPPDPKTVSATIEKLNSQPSHSLETFSFPEVSSSTVEKAVGRVKSNAVGVDAISITLIRHILPSLLEPLTHIINYSFIHSFIPHHKNPVLHLFQILPALFGCL